MFDMFSVVKNQSVTNENRGSYLASITTLMGQSLKLMYPLLFSCYNGYQNEMKDPTMYLNPGSDFVPWLYTVTVQDQRVF